jgi:hypothetical protein
MARYPRLVVAVSSSIAHRQALTEDEGTSTLPTMGVPTATEQFRAVYAKLRILVQSFESGSASLATTVPLDLRYSDAILFRADSFCSITAGIPIRVNMGRPKARLMCLGCFDQGYLNIG